VQPFERNVPVNVRQPVVFVLDECALDENASVYVDVAVAWRHHLTRETGERKENLVCKASDAPRKSEVKVKGRKTRLQHALMLSVPVKRTFGPVSVTIKDVWDCI
jgi:hypothetical protein